MAATKITPAALRTLQAEMDAAFKNAGITGFNLNVESMRYTDTEVNIKVKGVLQGVKPQSDKLFEAKVAEYGLKLIGAKGETLTGFKASRPKYPFSYTTARGANYKCTIEQAKAIFGQHV